MRHVRLRNWTYESTPKVRIRNYAVFWHQTRNLHGFLGISNLHEIYQNLKIQQLSS